ncbi:MAG: sensor N-terminal transmembrane domain-containing protein, partial [Pseudomonadota bacterium]
MTLTVADPGSESGADPKAGAQRSQRRRGVAVELGLWLRSPLARRVLAVNLIAILIPIGGLSYLGVYEEELYAAQLQDLSNDAATIADALGTAAAASEDALDEGFVTLALRRLTPPDQRARFYDASRALVADTRRLSGPYGLILVEPLPALSAPTLWDRAIDAAGRFFAPPAIPRRSATEAEGAPATVLSALDGDPMAALYDPAPLSAAAPVRRYRQVLGAVLLTSDTDAIARATTAARTKVLA